MMTAREYVLDGLMRRYKERVPDVNRILGFMKKEGLIQSDEDIINDHIAFRTLGVPHLGIQSLEKIFLSFGYKRKDFYHFESKKLHAYWYSPPTDIPNLPRIFISQLLVDELSENSQKIIRSYTDLILEDPVDQLDLSNGKAIDHFLHTPLWDMPTWDDYDALQQESEYASWVILNRYYLNHFTISVHALPKFNTIEIFNVFLEDHGIVLNSAGGKIKVSGDGLLIQSSTVAAMVDVTFPVKMGGEITKSIPGSYVEFAERRYVSDGGRRDGFEIGNADKIFESTYTEQTKKRHD